MPLDEIYVAHLVGGRRPEHADPAAPKLGKTRWDL
jgi:hypothetical protein